MRKSRIKQQLSQLQPEYIDIIDESDKHHVPEGCETHFKVVLVSEKFQGLSRVARHQWLYQLLSDELKTGLHALSLHLTTPIEWQEQGHRLQASPICRNGYDKSVNQVHKYGQHYCQLPAKSRGFHIITPIIRTVLDKLPAIQTGLIHLFLPHTSASIVISENSCNNVPLDLETHFNRLIPDDLALYRHISEGNDDMPAHLKNSIIGASLTIPITDGQLALGQWQGIYLCEHRNHARARQLIITIHGF
jgi:secondary thiamine-phosphate synthase enzyme